MVGRVHPAGGSRNERVDPGNEWVDPSTYSLEGSTRPRGSPNPPVVRVDVVTPRSYTSRVRFEWDEAKREANLRKHGIDFVGIEALFEGHTFTYEDERFGYGEQRFLTLGLHEGRIVMVAHTEE